MYMCVTCLTSAQGLWIITCPSQEQQLLSTASTPLKFCSVPEEAVSLFFSQFMATAYLLLWIYFITSCDYFDLVWYFQGQSILKHFYCQVIFYYKYIMLYFSSVDRQTCELFPPLVCLLLWTFIYKLLTWAFSLIFVWAATLGWEAMNPFSKAIWF